MKKLCYSLLFIFLVVCGVDTSHAQVSDPQSQFEQILSLRRIGSPQISPNGEHTLFTVRSTDWKKNGYDTEIWLSKNGQKPFQLTNTYKSSSSSPQWSPDGKWISFVADRGNKRQIHLLRLEGGEAQAITNEKDGVGSYEWSPDGKHIAFTKREGESKADKKRVERYGRFAVEDNEYKYSHLWVVEVQTDLWPRPEEMPCPEGDSTCVSYPKAQQLTSGSDYTVSGFEWSPDGTQIAFSHQPNPDITSFMKADISILTIEDKSIRALVSEDAPESGATWSPDGEWILYSRPDAPQDAIFYANSHLYKVPAKGGESVRIAEDVDENIRSVNWTKQGIFGVVRQKANQYVYLIDPKTGKARQFSKSPDEIGSFSITTDGNYMAFSGNDHDKLPEIYMSATEGFSPRKITDMTGQITEWNVGTSEMVSWKSKDGAEIQGVLHKPADFDPNKKYPLLVVIHGGPTGVDRPTPAYGGVYPINQWLEKGAVVLRPNYRGSAGYGEKFRALNVRNLGVGDAWDVLSGVDYLIEEGFVDSTKMGAMGWSQGGYISAFLTTHTNRFKAISVGAGISNWMTYYVNTDIHPFTRQYLKGTPWDDPEIYAKTSPMTNINQAQTPTLIQHGEFDRRVPIPNAYELYQGLQDQGVDAKLIVYKGFGHGISKPKERLAAMWHNWEWFGKYIWGE